MTKAEMRAAINKHETLAALYKRRLIAEEAADFARRSQGKLDEALEDAKRIDEEIARLEGVISATTR